MFKMVRNIRAVEQMMDPTPYIPDVSAARAKLGRSLVSRRRILPGETITEDMLCLKSPGDGIRWRDRDKVIGSKARVMIPSDVTLQTSDVTQTEEAATNVR
jgi:sialic acid synthase